MNRIPERIENRRNIEVDRMRMTPDIRHRQHDVFRESSGTIHADAERVRAQMTTPGETIAAPSPNHLAFTADDVGGMKIVDVRSGLDGLAHQFGHAGHAHANGAPSPIATLDNVTGRP